MGAGRQRPSASTHGGDLAIVVGRVGNIDQAKEAVRDRVWRLLEREGAVPEGSYGKIPGFRGAEATAERLAELESGSVPARSRRTRTGRSSQCASRR